MVIRSEQECQCADPLWHFRPRVPRRVDPLDIYGVCLGTWLNLEDWAYCDYGATQDVSGGYGGACLPPQLAESQLAGGGFQPQRATEQAPGWSSEGQLTTWLCDTYGADKARSVLERHRNTYYSERDFEEMSQIGIRRVRLVVGWWASAWSPVKPDRDGLFTDPYAATRTRFVPVNTDLLLRVLDWCDCYCLEVLLDLHAMPGGAGKGSYNGVFPAECAFWTYVGSGEDLGLQTWKNILKWYLSLQPRHKRVVRALGPMNEPAHLLPQFRQKIRPWLQTAVDAYISALRRELDPPELNINLINTAWSSQEDFWKDAHEWMSEWAAALKRSVPRARVFLDVHQYYAWETDIVDTSEPAPYSLSQSGLSKISQTQESFFHSLYQGSDTYGRMCSEMSLAFYHISSSCDPSPLWRQAMYILQAGSFARRKCRYFFWTWKMPFGWSHQFWWSLKENVLLLQGASDALASSSLSVPETPSTGTWS